MMIFTKASNQDEVPENHLSSKAVEWTQSSAQRTKDQERAGMKMVLYSVKSNRKERSLFGWTVTEDSAQINIGKIH